MPKEKINHAPLYIETDPNFVAPEGVTIGEVIPWVGLPGGEAPYAWMPNSPVRKDAELVVGWRRDAWVQLSIEGDPAYFAFAAKTPDGEVTDDAVRTSVYTPPLTREELNKLIRVLRRARDQAFGRDE